MPTVADGRCGPTDFGFEPLKSLNSVDTSPMWAILVGIERYKSESVKTVTGAVKDVERMYELFTKDMGVSGDRIVVLKNEEATRHAIIRAFQSVLELRASGTVTNLPDYPGRISLRILESLTVIRSFSTTRDMALESRPLLAGLLAGRTSTTSDGR
jgi:hypothetical protein